ncbi:Uncharacterised protein [Bordetella pertussis]|nr:Uncharacterised protein [Bordetella pertussis]
MGLWSSTTSTRSDTCGLDGVAAVAAAGGAACTDFSTMVSLRSTETVVPTPGALRMTSVPPINSTRRRLMDRPRPVPGAGPASALPPTCENGLNSCRWSASLMPQPVSLTLNCTCAASPSGRAVTARTTWPSVVNLMALPTRFESTCFMRKGSINTSSTPTMSVFNTSSMPFWRANPSKTRIAPSGRTRSAVRTGARSNFPASIFAMSRMSPISSSRLRAESYATWMDWRSGSWSVGRSSASSSMPMIAFIGVRISWLIVARNVVLARLAASALSLASCSSRSSSARSVMSIQPPMMPLSSPSESPYGIVHW